MQMEFRLPMSMQTDSCLQLAKYAGLKEANSNSNFVFSPFSIYLGLSLVGCGSSGRTLSQMLSFLKSQNIDHLQQVGRQLVDSVKGPLVNGGPSLYFVNGVWIEKSVNLKPTFKDIVNIVYKAEAETVDFLNKPLEVTVDVNTRVEKETNGLIKNVLPHDSIGRDTRLLLANALYFKGEWKERFDKSKTKVSEFYLLDGSKVQVPFMTSESDQFACSCDGFKVLRLPYKQGDDYRTCFSMYIFLPDQRDGLRDLIEKVASDPGFMDRHLPVKQIQVRDFWIPKFKISFGFEASRILKGLELPLPFDENEAELTDMLISPSSDGRNLYVSGSYHKCFIEIDEAGAEATAASTATVVQPFYLPTPIDFVADHSFMFMVRDDLSGVMLFMGHLINPSAVGN
ncbi:PREDICTED: serpin-ZX-like [Nelumbo nucifera]|uniref:Serpin-ZX-like n=2 Tax=Nelumbo nucifera TaxID=4432 RepID=A0A1U7Z5C2_NELNU|nr:PREDICTED: serpin-ZX-like [Nelumbo nucifera]DAD48270.1 TPA_asm: hypothetical protein HUJ06_018207 [Nelumbo nucifera]